MNARELVEWAGRLPWRMVENLSDEDRIEDADGDVVMYGHWNTDQNDRDLILRATRAFLPMVEALECSHACATVRPDGSCEGCPVSTALAIANGEDQTTERTPRSGNKENP